MERYDYLSHIVGDVKERIKELDMLGQDAEYINDELWADDSVTGNASGSYTCDTWTAEEFPCHNWDLLAEACSELGYNLSVMGKGAEHCDVLIRCYLLPQAIDKALEELREG
jgi:hypothetical protein